MPHSIFIANRAEIAIRIARACRDLGMRSVAAYALDDAASQHICRADAAVALGKHGAAAYLDVEGLVDAAKRAGCTAVHPGYGFLSESAQFAEACAAAGLIFIGPAPDVLRLFGDKSAARRVAQTCGVPVLAGTAAPVDLASAQRFFADAQDQGMMIKAVAGGGGRGMRVVLSADEIAPALEAAGQEALAAFGCADLYCEALVRNARHIEVQILGDGQGGIVDFGERECSLQRRRQKVVEIAPSPSLTNTVRERIIGAAVRMARETRYQGLGTFEFLVDGNEPEHFVFIETNPRLQVEHTVTEEVYGVDLVQAQIRIAFGASLQTLRESWPAQLQPSGYAVQLRVNMETMQPDGKVVPSTGQISRYDLPAGPGIRIDDFGYVGYQTSTSFDALLAKVIVHARAGAYADLIARARRALGELCVQGVDTNVSYLAAVLDAPAVLANEVSTDWLDTHAQMLAAHAARWVAPASFKVEPHVTAAIHVETSAAPQGTQALISPMQGVVRSIHVHPGDAVCKGQQVAILEAMKMQHAVQAMTDGVVHTLLAEEGSSVRQGDVLAYIEPGAAGGAQSQASNVSTQQESEHGMVAEIAELKHRRQLALQMGGEEGIKRQHARGKLTARERIDALADRGSFAETMALAGAATYDGLALTQFTPKPYVEGVIRLDGRKVFVNASDFTVRGGSAGFIIGLGAETALNERALAWRLPLVRLLDAAGGSVRSFEEIGRTYLPDGNIWTAIDVKLLNAVPVVSAVLGSVAGLPAILAPLSHFSVMVKDISQIFPGGPPVVKAALGVDITKEALGGDQIHTRISGCIDNLAVNEQDAYAQIRRFLSYLPASVDELPARIASDDSPDRVDEALLSVIPKDRRRPFDAHRLLQFLVDRDSFFEIAPDHGKSRITGLARFNGYPVGIMCNNPRVNGGATDVAAGGKASRLIQLCNTFHLPLISLADEPGFQVGLEAEKLGIERAGARMVSTVCMSEMPWCTVVIGRLYGVGGQSHHRPSGMYRRFAWPSASWGSMHIAGGVAAAYRSEIERADDPAAKQAEIEARLHALASPFRTAEATGQDIIDPRETRALLCDFVEDAQRVLAGQLGVRNLPYLP